MTNRFSRMALSKQRRAAGTRRADAALTRRSLGAIARAARDKTVWIERHGVVLEPYRDYRGVEVIGAWSWLIAYDIGVIAEISAAEAFAPKLDADALAEALQEAWRAFHRGDFKAAFDAGETLGPVGASVALSFQA